MAAMGATAALEVTRLLEGTRPETQSPEAMTEVATAGVMVVKEGREMVMMEVVFQMMVRIGGTMGKALRVGLSEDRQCTFENRTS